MSKILLVVIFNNRFDGNIAKLKSIYGERFSHIRFIIPFYDGDDPDVICVYESSFQFQGFIAQAYEKIHKDDYDSYIFLADDLILSPEINENNFFEKINIAPSDAFIESINPLNKWHGWYYKRIRGVQKAFLKTPVNYKQEIPSLEYALHQAAIFGFEDCAINNLIRTRFVPKKILMNCRDTLYRLVYPFKIEYPLVVGYSDFIVIPGDKLKQFSRFSGVFAAMRLFVEVAIPTTLLLIMEKDRLKTQKDTRMIAEKMWEENDIANQFEQKCMKQISNIKKNWPNNYLYVHPIKLSRWK